MPLFAYAHDAEHFRNHRVCARCYSVDAPLNIRHSAEQFEVYCPDCENTWGGATISKRYYEELEQQWRQRWLTARENVPHLVGIKTTKMQTQEDVENALRDLGF